eukprot:4361083-Amphidinium_carterae.1
MTSLGIYKSELMLFDVMKRFLPTESFLKLGVVNAIDANLAQPKTLAECLSKLRTYLQDCQIAINMLNTIGKTNNVVLSTLRVYNVLAGFVHHVSGMDAVLTTRIELLGQVSDSHTLQALFTWATKVLGLIAERVREDKQFRTQQGNKPANKPSATAPDGTSNKTPKEGKPNPAASTADGTPKPPKGKGKGDGKKGRDPSKPPPKETERARRMQEKGRRTRRITRHPRSLPHVQRTSFLTYPNCLLSDNAMEDPSV